MAGGSLNISSHGTLNLILTGNPVKTYYKVAYVKYTNFGLQKFRIDSTSISTDLRVSEDSVFTFQIKKYGDLLMDTYAVVEMPNIWSPIYNPSKETNSKWAAYDFKWISDIGCQMIREIEITCGSILIQKYSGQYLSAMVDRDFTSEKKKLFNTMSGNVVEMYDPANSYGRENAYPSAYYTANPSGAEPSIRGRTLYIPINSWFTLNSRCAFPIKAMKNHELQIKITIRPILELIRLRDICDDINHYPYIQPDLANEAFQMYRFLQPPPDVRIDTTSNTYKIKHQTWNSKIYLLCTYCFLSPEEAAQFSSKEQSYLIKEIHEFKFYGIVGTGKIRLPDSKGLVSSWMFFFQRNDVQLRNEWDNYSNWPYRALPSNVTWAPTELPPDINVGYSGDYMLHSGPGANYVSEFDSMNTNFFISGDKANANQKNILLNMGIQFDGIDRESSLDSGVFDYIEKYTRTNSFSKSGLYCYQFCLTTNPHEYQPSGAINLTFFKRIELDIVTFQPDIDTSHVVPNHVQCNQLGQPVSVSRKNRWELFEYHYNMTLFEERYNIITISNGNISIMMER